MNALNNLQASLLGARFAGQCACVESEREKESDIMCVCVSVEEACPCDKERRKPTRDKGRIWERRACVGGLKIVKESLGDRKKACAWVCVRESVTLEVRKRVRERRRSSTVTELQS